MKFSSKQIDSFQHDLSFVIFSLILLLLFEGSLELVSLSVVFSHIIYQKNDLAMWFSDRPMRETRSAI